MTNCLLPLPRSIFYIFYFCFYQLNNFVFLSESESEGIEYEFDNGDENENDNENEEVSEDQISCGVAETLETLKNSKESVKPSNSIAPPTENNEPSPPVPLPQISMC